VFHKLTALILALLIGSPLCCCGFGERAPDEGQAEEHLSPCCKAARALEQDNEQNDPTPECPKCPCNEFAKRAIELTDAHLATPPSTDVGDDFLSAERLDLPRIREIGIVELNDPIPRPPVRQAYCVYLI